MGTRVADLSKNVTDPHPYGDFVKFNNPAGSQSLTNFQYLLNTYFGRLGGDLETKLRMFQVVGDSIMFEEMLANGVYTTGQPQGF